VLASLVNLSRHPLKWHQYQASATAGLMAVGFSLGIVPALWHVIREIIRLAEIPPVHEWKQWRQWLTSCCSQHWRIVPSLLWLSNYLSIYDSPSPDPPCLLPDASSDKSSVNILLFSLPFVRVLFGPPHSSYPLHLWFSYFYI